MDLRLLVDEFSAIYKRDRELSIIAQFLSFSIVGAIATSVHYSVLIVGVALLSIRPSISSAAGFVAGIPISYTLNYHITFRSNKKYLESGIKFVIIILVGLLINTTLMVLLAEMLMINYIISQIIATILVLFWNFFGNRLWTF